MNDITEKLELKSEQIVEFLDVNINEYEKLFKKLTKKEINEHKDMICDHTYRWLSPINLICWIIREKIASGLSDKDLKNFYSFMEINATRYSNLARNYRGAMAVTRKEREWRECFKTKEKL